MGRSSFGKVPPHPSRRSRRHDREACKQLWSQPTIRRLEPRRVLNAAIQSLVVPAAALEGDTIFVSAEGTGEAVLEFDWSVSRDGEHIAAGEGNQFQFVAPEDGQYSVDLSLTDGDGTTDMASANIAVSNAAPTITSYNVSQPDAFGLISVTGTVWEPGTDDTVTMQVDWLHNGAIVESNTTELNSGLSDFLFTHQLSGVHSESFEPYEVVLRATDSDGGRSSLTLSGFSEEGPSGLVIDPVTMVQENDLATLSLRFDVGENAPSGSGVVEIVPLDSYTVMVDWGDGSTPESFLLGADHETTQLSLVASHRYRDDPAGVGDNELFDIHVSVADQYENSVSGTTSVLVKNVAPSELTFDPVAMINENQEAELFLSFTDPGFLDVHTVTIDWGDGSANTVETIPVGQRDLLATHRYRDDNPTATTQDEYTITVTVADDDLGEVTETTSVLVKNVAPSELTFDPVAMINENQEAELFLSFTDPGFLDVHTVTIDWGDGSANTVETIPVGQRDLLATHRYRDDNPTATTQDEYKIKVTVADDDLGEGLKSTSVLVKNVDPVLLEVTQVDDNTPGGEATIIVETGDVGADTFRYEVFWGDGTSFVSEIPASMLPPEVPDGAGMYQAQQRVTLSHVYSVEFLSTLINTNIVEGTLRVFDDDLGMVEVPLEIELSNTIITMPPQPTPFVEGGGESTIVEQAVDVDLGASVPQAGAVLIRLQVPDIRAVISELATSAETYLLLKVINPDGTEGQSIKMDAEKLYDLEGFFNRLPDNDYEVWLINTETGVKRLVVGASVRRGRAVDPADETDGGQEMPPSEDAPIDLHETAPEDATPRLEPLSDTSVQTDEPAPLFDGPLFEANESDFEPQYVNGRGQPVILATGVAAITSPGHWAKQIDHALARADGNQWRRLRVARRLRRPTQIFRSCSRNGEN